MADKTYCYENTNTLRNLLDIRDPETLLLAETELAAVRLAELQVHPEKGKFDFIRLQLIHRRIFQDLYEWAGKPRTVDIAKNNSLFCPAWNIEGYARDVFRNFYKDCSEAADDRKRFVHVFAGHYADLNALHPFREGNGRAQREFARELCMECGYMFDMMEMAHEEMVTASRQSLEKGDNTELKRIFDRAVKTEKQ